MLNWNLQREKISMGGYRTMYMQFVEQHNGIKININNNNNNNNNDNNNNNNNSSNVKSSTVN